MVEHLNVTQKVVSPTPEKTKLFLQLEKKIWKNDDGGILFWLVIVAYNGNYKLKWSGP